MTCNCLCFSSFSCFIYILFSSLSQFHLFCHLLRPLFRFLFLFILPILLLVQCAVPFSSGDEMPALSDIINSPTERSAMVAVKSYWPATVSELIPRLAAISHQPPTLMIELSSRIAIFVHALGTDRIENIAHYCSSIVAMVTCLRRLTQ
jgi:hypothetical protein